MLTLHLHPITRLESYLYSVIVKVKSIVVPFIAKLRSPKIEQSGHSNVVSKVLQLFSIGKDR